MTITWLAQANLLSEDTCNIIESSAQDAGCQFEPINIIPFTDNIDLDPLRTDIIVPYGSTTFIKKFSEGPWNKAGFFFNKFNLKTSTWIDKLDNVMLNYDAHVVTLQEARKYIKEGTWFIKPDDDLKDFNGTMVTKQDLDTFYDKVSSGGHLFSENIQVVLAPVKNTGWEYRLFMVNGYVVASSSYKLKSSFNKTRMVPSDVVRFAEEAANIWQPDNVYVVDVAETNDGLKVVEFNCFNASGFYDCDITRVVQAVSQHVHRTAFYAVV